MTPALIEELWWSERKSVSFHRDKNTHYFYFWYTDFCRSPRFSSVFPKRLNGILHPDEFQQSIININRACRPTSSERLLIFCLFFSALIGLLIFITGIFTVWWRISSVWIPLMSVGFVLMIGFFTVAIFVSSRVYRLCDARLDKAIDIESRKHSTKSPSTKWRLDMTIYTRRYSTTLPTDIQYYVRSMIFIIPYNKPFILVTHRNRFSTDWRICKTIQCTQACIVYWTTLSHCSFINIHSINTNVTN